MTINHHADLLSERDRLQAALIKQTRVYTAAIVKRTAERDAALAQVTALRKALEDILSHYRPDSSTYVADRARAALASAPEGGTKL